MHIWLVSLAFLLSRTLRSPALKRHPGGEQEDLQGKLHQLQRHPGTYVEITSTAVSEALNHLEITELFLQKQDADH